MMDEQKALWTVTGVTDTQLYTPQTGTIHGKRVSFRLYDGTTSYVDVPLTDYNKEAVATRIHDAAARHQHIMALEGPPVSSDRSYSYAPSDVGT